MNLANDILEILDDAPCTEGYIQKTFLIDYHHDVITDSLVFLLEHGLVEYYEGGIDLHITELGRAELE